MIYECASSQIPLKSRRVDPMSLGSVQQLSLSEDTARIQPLGESSVYSGDRVQHDDHLYWSLHREKSYTFRHVSHTFAGHSKTENKMCKNYCRVVVFT